jgi:hypothetical protein
VPSSVSFAARTRPFFTHPEIRAIVAKAAHARGATETRRATCQSKKAAALEGRSARGFDPIGFRTQCQYERDRSSNANKIRGGVAHG